MLPPSLSTRGKSLVALVGLLVGVTTLLLGIDAVWFYAAPLLSAVLWYYAALHSTVGGLSPRNDPPDDPVPDTRGSSPPRGRLSSSLCVHRSRIRLTSSCGDRH